METDRSQTPDRSVAVRRLLILTMVALVAMVALAGYSAATRAMWTDELFSLLTAEEPYGQIIQDLSAYQPGYFDHPPLYFLLLRNVLYYSNSPLALRILSMLVTAAGAIFLASSLIRRDFHTAVAASFLLAVITHPIILKMGTMARMYALVFFLACVLIYVLHYLEKKLEEQRFSTIGVLFLAVPLAAMYYTSYFTGLLGAGLGFLGVYWWLNYRKSDDRKQFSRLGFHLVLAVGCSGILFLPWAPVLWKMVQEEGAREESAALLTTAKRFRFLLTWLFDSGGSALGCIFLVTGWLGIILNRKERRSWLELALFLSVTPALLLAFLTPPQRLLSSRYLIYTFPILWVGALVGFQQLVQMKPWMELRRHVLLIAILVIVSINGYWHSRQTFMKPVPDWWEVAWIFEHHAQPREVIMTGGHLSGEAVVYHLDQPEDFSFLHYVTDIDTFYVSSRDPNVVWYVNSAPLPKAYEDILNRYFPYSSRFAGNMKLGPGIQIWSKKPFTRSTGENAEFQEPIPLSYEQNQPTTSP